MNNINIGDLLIYNSVLFIVLNVDVRIKIAVTYRTQAFKEYDKCILESDIHYKHSKHQPVIL